MKLKEFGTWVRHWDFLYCLEREKCVTFVGWGLFLLFPEAVPERIGSGLAVFCSIQSWSRGS